MVQTEIKEFDADVKRKIGQRIQEARIAKGLTGVDVAAYLDIQKNQMSRIENGRANCTVPQLFILSQLLDCSVDYLLFGKNQVMAISTKQEAAIKALLAAFSKNHL
jgi:transcriptional regulator with XRE-family HTH domain